MKKRVLVLVIAIPFPAPAENRYTRDKNGRITRVEYPDGRAVAYTYDASGNLVRREFIAPQPATAPESKDAAYRVG